VAHAAHISHYSVVYLLQVRGVITKEPISEATRKFGEWSAHRNALAKS
jgi:hypothetical protein